MSLTIIIDCAGEYAKPVSTVIEPAPPKVNAVVEVVL